MLPVSVVMKVNGLHGDVRVKGVPVEHDSAYGAMSSFKVVREGTTTFRRKEIGTWNCVCVVKCSLR